MIHISEAIAILNDKQVHSVEFISKSKGTIVKMKKAVVTSSNHQRRKFNLKSIISNQIRWAYYVLLIKIDDEEIYL